ncbi:MAG TPA: TIGR02996 domain-containing protein [Kofleriaceae bacterium]|nr:TIGR02996 domain-containing protein [Kofleriaceae bacterium]
MTPEERSLIAAIAADPDEDGPRIVYADWLQEIGDPYGEFIAIQCALARGRTPELAAREQSLLERHHAEWLARAGLGHREGRFRRGFIEQVDAGAGRVAAAIERLIELPSLRSLRTTVDGGGSEADLMKIAEGLRHRMPRSLDHVMIDRRLQWNSKHSDEVRRQGSRLLLHLDEPTRAPAAIAVFESMLAHSPELTAIEVALCGRGRVEIDELVGRIHGHGPRPAVRAFDIRFANPAARDWVQWIATHRLDDLVATFPALETLTLPVAEVWNDSLTHARLRELSLGWLGGTPYGPSDSMVWGAGPAPRGTGLAYLRGARLPALERLAIDFHYDWYVGWAAEDIAALCEAAGLPRLTSLVLRYSLLGDEICRRLPAAPFAAQLKELDLTAIEVSDEAARHFVRHRGAFESLERLVSYRFDGVSDATWADLAAAYPLEEPP